MKSTELMIGDWVSCGGTPIRVENVHGDCINFQHDIPFVQEEFMIDFAEIVPISLTPEIFEKNGFSLDAWFKPHLQWRSADNRILLHNEDEYLNTFNKWHVHVDTEDMRTIGSIELTYVHQFQQFLRLCGMNELADNLKFNTMSKTFGQIKAGDDLYIIKGCNVEIVKVQSAELNTAKTAVFIISEECNFSVYVNQSSCHYGMKTGDIYCDIDDAMRAMQDICAKALHDYKRASGALNKLETLKRK